METLAEPPRENALPIIKPMMKLQWFLSEVTVVLMALLMAVEVICRDLFNFSLLITDEVGGYFLVVLVFLGMGAALHDGALFRVTAVLRVLPRRARGALQLVFDILSLAFGVMLSYQMVQLVHGSYVRGVQADSILSTPLWIPQSVMVFGAVTITLVLVGQVIAGFMAVFGRRA